MKNGGKLKAQMGKTQIGVREAVSSQLSVVGRKEGDGIREGFCFWLTADC